MSLKYVPLTKYGFVPDNYEKIIVSWGWTAQAAERARDVGVTLWDFRHLVRDIATVSTSDRTYFTDDTARTIQLFAKSIGAP